MRLPLVGPAAVCTVEEEKQTFHESKSKDLMPIAKLSRLPLVGPAAVCTVEKEKQKPSMKAKSKDLMTVAILSRLPLVGPARSMTVGIFKERRPGYLLDAQAHSSMRKY